MFVSLYLRLLPSLYCFEDLVVVATTHMTIMTLGRFTFRHENGLSYNALGPFHPPVQVMLQLSSMMLCMYLVGISTIKPDVGDLTCLQLVMESDLAVGPHALIHIQYSAQRWTAFQDIGPGPCERWGRASNRS